MPQVPGEGLRVELQGPGLEEQPEAGEPEGQPEAGEPEQAGPRSRILEPLDAQARERLEAEE